MAKKTLLEDPPTASSSDEDELETSAGEEEELSSSEDDEPKDHVKASSAAVSVAVPESESESETDSDSEAEQPSNPGKAIASPTKPSKTEAARPSAALALPAEKSGTKKRPSEGSSRDTNAKQAKKVTAGEEEKNMKEETKKPAFQRIFNEEDEIALLQGMIDFHADTAKSPCEDSNGLFDFTKKSISFEVSKNQFMDKIRTMKKKYLGKEKNGVEPSSLKAHDRKFYELSKIIWGPQGLAFKSVAKSNAVLEKSPRKKNLDTVKKDLMFQNEDDKKALVHGDSIDSSDAWFENWFLARLITGFGVDEHYVKQGWGLVTVSNKKKLEDKLRDFQAKELQKKSQLLHEATLMIIEASKKKIQSNMQRPLFLLFWLI